MNHTELPLPYTRLPLPSPSGHVMHFTLEVENQYKKTYYTKEQLN